MPDDKQNFEVTEKAGVFVAGIRSPGAGKTVRLTAAQAHHALRAGELVAVKAGPAIDGDAGGDGPVRGRRSKAAEAKTGAGED